MGRLPFGVPREARVVVHLCSFDDTLGAQYPAPTTPISLVIRKRFVMTQRKDTVASPSDVEMDDLLRCHVVGA